MSDIPTISYDEISDRFKKDGVELHDVLGHHRHFYDWHRRNGLPDMDAAGNNVPSSEIFMTMYREDAAGEASAPAYVNVWHWLVSTYEDVAWDETGRGREKSVRLARGMHHPRPPLTPEEIDIAVEKIMGGSGLPESMRKGVVEHLAQDLANMVVRHNESLKIVDAILDRYGDDIVVRLEV